MAVLIDPDIASEGNRDESELNLSLAIAVSNYCDYYFYRIGRPSEISLLSSGLSVQQRLAQMDLAHYASIVHLKPEGDFRTRTVTVRDERRVSHFVQVPGFADISLQYRLVTIDGGRIAGEKKGLVRADADRYWLKRSTAIGSRELDSLVAASPEPIEYVIQRCLEKVLRQVSEGPKPLETPGEPIPSLVYVDSSLIRENPGQWARSARELHELASRYFFHSFNHSFRACDVRPIDLPAEPGSSLRYTYGRFKGKVAAAGDTLIVGMCINTDPVDYFLHKGYDQVGVSDIGQRRVIISTLPRPTFSSGFWEPHFNGLTLLHEIGHSFGAIHASDMNSVMSHTTTWLASARFDPFNRRVIEAALSGELTFDEPEKYLSFVSETLTKINYGLVDYPSFFYHFLEHGENQTIRKNLLDAVPHRPHVFAARAYGLLMAGKHSAAARLFRQAIKTDSTQASLYYYLALATTGPESVAAMQKAADLGYFLALIRLKKM
ncbi:MAG: hypothetical protein OEW00_07635 [candidate division Zixibacteria bacterium]|nr:hypothetical protein [candidate division Zixibacteria bacterium]